MASRTRFRLRYQTRIALWGLLFALPAVAYLLLFNLLPMANALYLSFTRYDLIGAPELVGLRNYARTLTDPNFHHSLRITFIYVFGTVVPVWFFSFGLAFLLYKVRLFAGGWRTLLFIPTILPLLSVTLVWKLLFNLRGVVNGLLLPLGIDPIPWLTDARFANLALIITSWWHASSYYMILFLAGLQAVPIVFQEAAALDGANGWQRMRHVILPLMRPTIVLVIVLSIINGFRTFALHYVMTGGGPGTATEIVPLLIYKTAFAFLDMGKATAISVLYFLMILIFSLVQLRVSQGEQLE
ncbi:MAG: sugar ABC transporter permease [Caldilineaceae bacterium]|nr:sugar ABC transporter permease [Caldilineaceae bacterium]